MRPGYTLLEILLATVVLAIGLSSVFGITQAARKRSVGASDLATVQLYCQTTLARLLANEAPIQPFSPINLPGTSQWKITLGIYPAPTEDLCVLHLMAQKFTEDGYDVAGHPFHLLRWIPKERVKIPESEPGPDEWDEFDDPFQKTML